MDSVQWSTASLAVCTIISHNYLSHARTLLHSYLEHEPEAHAYALVVDRMPEGVEFGDAVRVIDPDELRFENWDAFCFQYDATELCTAVKPRLLQLLMQQYGEKQLVYLDPDILVLQPFDALKRVLQTSSLVLTPHMLKPMPEDGKRPNEQDILISGAYNLGFLALRDCEQTRAFLEWWDLRLQNDCRVDVSQGLFVDQKWMDLAPGFYDGTRILRDETYNAAFWNLHERALGRDGEVFTVNGKPITFYHFSGFDPTKPRTLSKHQTRTTIEEGSALAALVDRYVALHMANGYETFIRMGYGYGRLDNGIRVNTMLRHLYFDTSAAQRAAFGNPFQTHQPHSFFEWVTTPGGEHRISPFLQELYAMHLELVTLFPDVYGKDEKPFIEWARSVGSQEIGYEPELVPQSQTLPHTVAPQNGAGAAPPTRDIYQGTLPPPAVANRTRLKAMWENERSIRALEEWAKDLERALLDKEAYVRSLEQAVALLDSRPLRAARWVRRKLNRPPQPH